MRQASLKIRVHRNQEIIKIRKRKIHIGLIPKVIPLKLFLYSVPSSSANVTRALCGYFRGGPVHVISFRFKAKDTSNAVGMSF